MAVIWVRGGQAFQPKPDARERAGLAERSSHRRAVSFHINDWGPSHREDEWGPFTRNKGHCRSFQWKL